MKNFFKLLNFEINRFLKLYIIMIIVIFIIQLGTVLTNSIFYMELVKDVTRGGRVTPEQFLVEYWPYSLTDTILSAGFLIPIAIGITGLTFYLFFIWYRDWFARNTFIYRLLMLPTSRMNIFYAKLTTIMLTVLATVAFQLIFLSIYQQVGKWIVPLAYREDMPISLHATSSPYLSVIVPDSLIGFLLAYGTGFIFTIVIFTAILFERSYQLIGIVIGVLYVIATATIFFSPLIVQLFMFNQLYLFADEMYYLQTVIGLMIGIVSLGVSHYLLTKKVTV